MFSRGQPNPARLLASAYQFVFDEFIGDLSSNRHDPDLLTTTAFIGTDPLSCRKRDFAGLQLTKVQ
jgi:hypothetical protein